MNIFINILKELLDTNTYNKYNEYVNYEYIRNIIYGLYVLYHYSQVKPDLNDILYMSHILPQTLGE